MYILKLSDRMRTKYFNTFHTTGTIYEQLRTSFLKPTCVAVSPKQTNLRLLQLSRKGIL